MSITQEYEQIRNEIGHKKYDAIDRYLNEVCPKENYNKYNNELFKLMNLPFDEWHKQKKELEKKYGIVFLSDVLYKPEEWDKFEKWYKENEEKSAIDKENNRTRTLENGIYVMDLGYRHNQPVALVERTFSDNTKEYIIAFNYEITDNKIEFGYGYYYSNDIEKAKEDFKKVLNGGNLVDTFQNEKQEQIEKNNKKRNHNKEAR